MNHPRSLVAGLVVAAAVLSLSGCISAGSVPSTAPTTIVTPTATLSAEPVSRPQPILDLTCTDLISASSLASSFAKPIAAAVPLPYDFAGSRPLPASFAVLSLGGLSCGWDNGQPDTMPSGAYRFVRVDILPNAASAFDFYATQYHGTVGVSCSSQLGSPTCLDQELVGTTWVGVLSFGTVDADAGTALAREVVSAVSSAGPGAAPWSIPPTTRQLPAMCDGLITADAVQSIAGVGSHVVIGSNGRDEEYSIDDASLAAWGSQQCYWRVSDQDLYLGAVLTLPGGAWGWEEALPTISPAPEPLALEGLLPGDAAWSRCAGDGKYCFVDMTIGGNWIEVIAFAHDNDVPVDNRAFAAAASAAVVANLVP